MRPEFPFDTWFNKHVTPLRLLLFSAFFIVSILAAPYYLTTDICWNVYLSMLGAIMVGGAGMMAWQIVWNIKYPYVPEFCKECKQVLPEKFEE